MIDLAHLRNQLSNNVFKENEEHLFEEIRTKVELYDSIFAKVILKGLGNALMDARQRNFESASREMQFIHNLPISDEELRGWDEKYFYTCELLGYLDTSQNQDRIKEYIILLAEVINKNMST